LSLNGESTPEPTDYKAASIATQTHPLERALQKRTFVTVSDFLTYSSDGAYNFLCEPCAGKNYHDIE